MLRSHFLWIQCTCVHISCKMQSVECFLSSCHCSKSQSRYVCMYIQGRLKGRLLQNADLPMGLRRELQQQFEWSMPADHDDDGQSDDSSDDEDALEKPAVAEDTEADEEESDEEREEALVRTVFIRHTRALTTLYSLTSERLPRFSVQGRGCERGRDRGRDHWPGSWPQVLAHLWLFLGLGLGGSRSVTSSLLSSCCTYTDDRCKKPSTTPGPRWPLTRWGRGLFKYSTCLLHYIHVYSCTLHRSSLCLCSTWRDGEPSDRLPDQDPTLRGQGQGQGQQGLGLLAQHRRHLDQECRGAGNQGMSCGPREQVESSSHKPDVGSRLPVSFVLGYVTCPKEMMTLSTPFLRSTSELCLMLAKLSTLPSPSWWRVSSLGSSLGLRSLVVEKTLSPLPSSRCIYICHVCIVCEYFQSSLIQVNKNRFKKQIQQRKKSQRKKRPSWNKGGRRDTKKGLHFSRLKLLMLAVECQGWHMHQCRVVRA